MVMDLHGLSQEEALKLLNESLPKWFDTAMKGDYTFVISVDIICGGGNQILPEIVGEWINANRKLLTDPRHQCEKLC